MKNEDIRLEVCSDPKLLRSVRALLQRYVVSQGFSEERAEQAVLAVDEACANAIRHSYGGSCQEKLEILLTSIDEGLEITLTDRGTPAPAGAVVRKDIPEPDPATLKPGGLGVQLIYKVFDEVEFRPGERRGNMVRMCLRRGRTGPGASEGRPGEGEGARP